MPPATRKNEDGAAALSILARYACRYLSEAVALDAQRTNDLFVMKERGMLYGSHLHTTSNTTEMDQPQRQTNRSTSRRLFGDSRMRQK
jgi:hypothetical protein